MKWYTLNGQSIPGGEPVLYPSYLCECMRERCCLLRTYLPFFLFLFETLLLFFLLVLSSKGERVVLLRGQAVIRDSRLHSRSPEHMTGLQTEWRDQWPTDCACPTRQLAKQNKGRRRCCCLISIHL